jgi:hypothetical protein
MEWLESKLQAWLNNNSAEEVCRREKRPKSGAFES